MSQDDLRREIGPFQLGGAALSLRPVGCTCLSLGQFQSRQMRCCGKGCWGGGGGGGDGGGVTRCFYPVFEKPVRVSTSSPKRRSPFLAAPYPLSLIPHRLVPPRLNHHPLPPPTPLSPPPPIQLNPHPLLRPPPLNPHSMSPKSRLGSTTATTTMSKWATGSTLSGRNAFKDKDRRLGLLLS